jgi:glutaredoxin
MPYKCKRCKTTIYKKTNFCDDCRWVRRHLDKRSSDEELGTTDFSENMVRKKNGDPDWQAEAVEIQLEMDKLRLRRKKK